MVTGHDAIFVNIPLPSDLNITDQVCKLTCHGQTSPGKIGGKADPAHDQRWDALKYPDDPLHMMFFGRVDVSECDFLSPPVVSVSLAAKSPNLR
jgi:hypothetical protein